MLVFQTIDRSQDYHNDYLLIKETLLVSQGGGELSSQRLSQLIKSLVSLTSPSTIPAHSSRSLKISVQI